MSAHDTHYAHGHGHHDHGPHHVTPASTFLNVLIALLILTAITVGTSRIDFGSANMLIAMFIASIKAFLVAGFFMHLLSEKKTIYSMLAVTGVFFVFMMFLIIWGSNDQPLNTVMKPLYVP